MGSETIIEKNYSFPLKNKQFYGVFSHSIFSNYIRINVKVTLNI